MKIDLHTHTIISGHAYSTLKENIEAARARGLEAFAVTDHGPAMPGVLGEAYHVVNMRLSVLFSWMESGSSGALKPTS